MAIGNYEAYETAVELLSFSRTKKILDFFWDSAEDDCFPKEQARHAKSCRIHWIFLEFE